jgi:hypothetical protein
MRRTFVVALAVLLLAVGVAVGDSRRSQPTNSPEIALAAKKSGCYGASCTGKNPTGLCDDGITVASKAVVDGVLELRYSRSCKANWGRYTPYRQNAYGYTLSKIVIHARVTAWNPGAPSVNSAHTDTSITQFGTSWSQMVDGTKAACTGVELSYSGEGWQTGVHHSDPPTGWDDKVWQWGLCY